MDQRESLDGKAVLVVEDDAEIAELIAVYLRKEGASVETAPSAEDAYGSVLALQPSAVILDLGLPGADGLEFLRSFRESSDAPVIIVSARESDEDKIRALGLGADDFVQKPFSPRVLAARVKAQLRRSASQGGNSQAGDREIERFGPFRIDYSGKVLNRGNGVVALSKREFELLAFLASNPRKTYAAEELFRLIWGKEFGDLSTVAVHIQRLRKKIEEDPADPRWIRTVPGFGYRFAREERS
jgi:DNA-binding response OmpR family regulator